ncbi:hypothetical protein PIB30_068830 [Stylosanthes scabra]|uniref:Uncharacterized protein n=1 Tax=Stylosanthes scabra TaxID=79078 RepID=A0ABU6VPV3_9FABA|nr:hypothetical protein [Stylosanthes scabra]
MNGSTDMMGYLISVQQCPAAHLDDGSTLGLTLIEVYANGLNPLEPCYTGLLTMSDDGVALAIDDDFVIPAKSATIHELRTSQKAGLYTVVGTIKGICNKFDWWYYSCACGCPLKLARNAVNNIPPYPPSFEDVIGIEVCFRIEKKTTSYYGHIDIFRVINCCDESGIISKFKSARNCNLYFNLFSPMFEDVIERPQAHDEVPSLGNRMSISHDIMQSIEVDVNALGASHDIPKPDPYTFLVGMITSICYDKGWWYWICLCGEKYDGNDLIPFCQGCFTHCYDGILRYKVTVVVTDPEGQQIVVFHDKDVAYLMKEECASLLKKQECFILGDLLGLDGSAISSNLIEKQLVFMIDPFPIEHGQSSNIYNVFRESANPFLVQLFQDANQSTSLDDVASYEIIDDVMAENKFVSQFDQLPNSVKDKLNSEFNHWLDMQCKEVEDANAESSNEDFNG